MEEIKVTKETKTYAIFEVAECKQIPRQQVQSRNPLELNLTSNVLWFSYGDECILTDDEGIEYKHSNDYINRSPRIYCGKALSIEEALKKHNQYHTREIIENAFKKGAERIIHHVINPYVSFFLPLYEGELTLEEYIEIYQNEQNKKLG